MQQYRSRRKPAKLKRYGWHIIIGFLSIIAIFIVIKIFPDIASSLEKLSFAPKVVGQLVLNRDINLKNDNGRINVLLLGIAGGTHDGPLLSDTIIFASVDPSNKKTTLISIPRDLWIPSLHAKVNSAYALGEEKQKGGGLSTAKATIQDAVGQPIGYAVRIDFSGFEKVVDELGGIDVDVAEQLDDYAYPITGKEDDPCGKTPEDLQQFATGSADQFDAFPCRYEHIHFDKGITHMDGATALKYVRSRHGIGDQGSDFARSRRQQQVITAVKNKVFSIGTLLNPFKMKQLLDTLGQSVDTDITENEYDDFIRLAQKVKEGQIVNSALDQGDGKTGRVGLLINPPISKYSAWVLEPENADFTQIKQYVRCEITHVATSSAEKIDVCATYKPIQ